MEWKDCTHYARGQRGKDTPRVWEASAGNFVLTVHVSIHDPGNWFLTCAGLGLNSHNLNASDAKEAKVKALHVVELAANKRIEDLRALQVAATQAIRGTSCETC